MTIKEKEFKRQKVTINVDSNFFEDRSLQERKNLEKSSIGDKCEEEQQIRLELTVKSSKQILLGVLPRIFIYIPEAPNQMWQKYTGTPPKVHTI